MILVSTMGFSGTPDMEIWPENTLRYCNSGESKMAAICSRPNNKLIYFSSE